MLVVTAAMVARPLRPVRPAQQPEERAVQVEPEAGPDRVATVVPVVPRTLPTAMPRAVPAAVVAMVATLATAALVVTAAMAVMPLRQMGLLSGGQGEPVAPAEARARMVQQAPLALASRCREKVVCSLGAPRRRQNSWGRLAPTRQRDGGAMASLVQVA